MELKENLNMAKIGIFWQFEDRLLKEVGKLKLQKVDSYKL
jgi:hypothetical protein